MRPHVVHAKGQGAERAVCSHTWHMRQARGRSVRAFATRGTCARWGRTCGVKPRVAHVPGSAERAV